MTETEEGTEEEEVEENNPQEEETGGEDGEAGENTNTNDRTQIRVPPKNQMEKQVMYASSDLVTCLCAQVSTL